MIEVDETTQSVNGVFQDLFDENSEPETVELGKEPYAIPNGAEVDASLGLKGLWVDSKLDFIEDFAQVLKEQFLNELVDLVHGLQAQYQQKEPAHIPPIV